MTSKTIKEGLYTKKKKRENIGAKQLHSIKKVHLI
jgi:hypothetical protein